MSKTPDGFILADLLILSDAFLNFAAALKRPLQETERITNRWILKAWEGEGVRDECRDLPKSRLAEITRRIASLRDLFYPDPVRQDARLACDRDGVTHDISSGNHKSTVSPMRGVRMRKMTEDEAEQRFQLLRKMVWSIHYVAQELSLYQGSRRELAIGKEFRQFSRLSDHLVKVLDPSATLPPTDEDDDDE
jgi:hypothetical protein